jgi:hypothetical protein
MAGLKGRVGAPAATHRLAATTAPAGFVME